MQSFVIDVLVSCGETEVTSGFDGSEPVADEVALESSALDEIGPDRLGANGRLQGREFFDQRFIPHPIVGGMRSPLALT